MLAARVRARRAAATGSGSTPKATSTTAGLPTTTGVPAIQCLAKIPTMSAAAAGPLIELRQVTKSYREGDRSHRVLDRVDARIRPGELVVMLGKSGSGKTTLLNLLSGIDLPDSRDVRIAGVSLPAAVINTTGIRGRSA